MREDARRGRYGALSTTDRAAWRLFVDRCPLASEEHLIDCVRGDIAEHRTQAIARWEGDRIVAGAHLWFRRMRFVPGCALRMLGGGLYHRTPSTDDLDELLDAVRDHTKPDKPIFIEWGLRLPRIVGDREVEGHRHVTTWLARRGLEPTPMLDATFWVDLSGSEDDILGRMHHMFRRNIRKADRDGVTCRRVGPEMADTFYDMNMKMAGLKRLDAAFFGVGSRTHFVEFIRGLLEVEAAALFCAEWNGLIRNMVLITCVGTPRYVYGATGEEARGDERPPPTGQILHWEVMRWLRSLGFGTYDLGGTPAREVSSDHPNFGVWQFKTRLGGQYVEFFSKHRLNCRPILSRAYRMWRG